MKWLNRWFAPRTSPRSSRRDRRRHQRRNRPRFESLERRELLASDVLPVLMVVADKQDFYYREYNETRISLEAAGLDVVVAATTTDTTYPHWNSGQGFESGAVDPDLALAAVNADDYSAIVFVGGWGASMYQYAYNDPNGDGVTDNFYSHGAYNGDDDLNDGLIAATKVQVNDLINEFLDDDKPVAAICHAVTVLAWARVDGASPLAGRQVAVPRLVSSPDQFYDGVWRNGGYFQGQYDQVLANGGLATPLSGQIGDPTTTADDVSVDGRIITAEDFNTSLYFGEVVAAEILASQPAPNAPPVASDANWVLPENSVAGTVVGQVAAIDPDAGQTLSYSIVAGNTGNAFAIDPATGIVTVANAAAVNFESVPVFALTVQVEDNGSPPLADLATVTINLLDVAESSVGISGGDLVVRGTDGPDTIYLWSGSTASQVYVWLNGNSYGPFNVGGGPHVRVFAGAGNDQVYATDLRVSAEIFGEDGHDLITGGTADDRLDGGAGVDRLWGGPGNDFIHGGEGNDFLFGREGNDVLLGGAGDDYLEGFDGRDLLVGGWGADRLNSGAGEDLLIGGTTDFDDDREALDSLLAAWTAASPFSNRLAALSDETAAIRLRPGDTVHQDEAIDTLVGGADADWFLDSPGDLLYVCDPSDHVTG